MWVVFFVFVVHVARGSWYDHWVWGDPMNPSSGGAMSPRDHSTMWSTALRNAPRNAPVCPDPSGNREHDFTRETVAYCFHYLADLNCDHAINATEIEWAKDHHLSYIEQFAVWAKTSVQIILQNCDTNGDGKVTHDEFLTNYATCLETQQLMCYARNICYREIPKGPPVCRN